MIVRVAGDVETERVLELLEERFSDWPEGGEEVPFFGQDMPTTLTPARLALRHGCDVVTGRAERVGDARFRVLVDPPLRVDEADPPLRVDEAGPPLRADEAGAARDEACRALTVSIHKHLERHIRERPGEWMCTNRRWAVAAADSHP